MDVTKEILLNRKIYGGDAGTKVHELAINKSLNYAKGGTIQNPIEETVNTAGYTVLYSDSVGLMGVENKFVKFNISIIDTGNFEIADSSGYYNAVTSDEDTTVSGWDNLVYNMTSEVSTVVNTYYSVNSEGTDKILEDSSYVEVNVDNLKTNNHYIDNWLDIRLYTNTKEEHPYDKMYLSLKDTFYIGFHARTTKRIPYNVKCTIGASFVNKSEITESQKVYLPRLYT